MIEGCTQVVFVQLLSHVWLFATPRTVACQASLSFTISCSLLKLMPIESVMPFNHLILFCPLLLLPSIFPSIRVFSNKLALCIRLPKLQFQHQSFRWIFRGDFWFDLVVQRTVKSLSQHHSSDFSILKTSRRSRLHFGIWLHRSHFSHDFKYLEINF